MIKEAILAHPEEKTGLGRPTIKKYIHQKHPETSKMPEAAFNNHVSKAITRGHEKKTFVLPKGISGRVKLAPDAKKAAVKKPAVKKAAATKTAKPAAAKKATTTKKTATKKVSHPASP
ncbi:hypothetical protein L7F22_011811 [Adiantum nelumboides]|nr:hypothetical protein [Adiantum nelumboides]